MPRSLLLLALCLSACAPHAGPVRSASPAASPAAAPVLYVDVRTPAEYAAGHVRGAVNIPHDQMEARWRELSAHRARPLVLYCHTGRRAGLALEVLRARGFSRLENGGGLEQLASRGIATEP